jgi:2-polyprenyl-6-methoxyphenol hydroxylase-like FAD-dependent oxidoreductase
VNRHPRKIVVVGAGVGGLTAAAGLSKAGFEVEVYERAKELRPAGTALSLMSNALTALDTLGIKPDFDGRAVVFDTLHFRTRLGRPIRALTFGGIARRLGQPNLAIHRASLQQALLEQAGDCKIVLGSTATGYTRDGDEVVVSFQDGREVRADVVIGADGFNSAIRRGVAGPEKPLDHGYICWRATPQFTHPVVTPAYASHYWGRGQRFGLVDLGGGQVYWWGTKNMSAERSANFDGGRAEILRLFDRWAPEIPAVIAATPEDTINSVPAQDRPFLEQWGDGPVTLVGDAAHPMLSSLGQGAAIAIEDGVVLAHCLSTVDGTEAALRAYEDRRRERTRAMVEASRSLSHTEQLEKPVQTLGRELYFRFARERTFERRNDLALTFPGV